MNEELKMKYAETNPARHTTALLHSSFFNLHASFFQP
jgi:hypothetical protein